MRAFLQTPGAATASSIEVVSYFEVNGHKSPMLSAEGAVFNASAIRASAYASHLSCVVDFGNF